MGYKSILQILLILAIISTICICIMKPKMNKPVMVYNSDFEIVKEDKTVEIAENNIPVMIQNADIETNKNSAENNFTDIPVQIENNTGTNISNNTNNINFNEFKDNQISNKKISANNTNIKTGNIIPSKTNIQTNNQPVKTTQIKTENPKIDLNKIVSNNQKIQNSQVQNIPEVKPVKQIQPVQPEPPLKNNNTISNSIVHPQKTLPSTNKSIALTAQEEEIAWNKWRSNLNNQIMRDSKLPTMPNGIIFKYKFTVDKFGKVSNVQTWSTTSSYTPYAIQFIAPVIRNYQGHSILNFPTGSNRVTTEVSGAWKISTNEKFSNPSDYNDVEKIKK